MRKLLILTLVLGMASMASATMTLVVGQSGTQGVAPAGDGYYDPVDTQLNILPSDYLWVGVYNDTDGVSGANEQGQFFMGIVTPDPATWTGAWAQYKPPLVPGAPDNAYMGPTPVGQPTPIDMWNLALTDGVPLNFNLIGVLDAKELHCEELGDVHVTLFNAGMVPIDTITIHQIPEPITMALLGLGGLFLRRRK